MVVRFTMRAGVLQGFDGEAHFAAERRVTVDNFRLVRVS